MPIYEYRCSDGHNFEVLQSMTHDPVTACTICGKPVQRVFHPVAVHFKGSGFYNTDYGKQKRGGSGAAPENGSSGESVSKDSKPDSKSSKSKSSSSSDD